MVLHLRENYNIQIFDDLYLRENHNIQIFDGFTSKGK